MLRDNEFHSALREQSFSNNPNLENDVMRTLVQIINKREEANINNQSEANKKQQVPIKTPQQTFRPSLILITGNQKTKEAAYAWFKLLANNEPLTKLSKKIPVFNKRADNLPEILITLHENQVPITRVIWYLKIMVLAYSTNVNDAQKKKRQQNIDVASEWSLPLSKFLREIFSRLQMYEQSPGCTMLNQQQLALESFMNVENLSLILLPIITTNYLTENKLRALWTFTTKLMRAMLDQNLLDKQFMLECLIDLLDKSTFSLHLKNSNPYLIETSTTKLVLTTISQNMFHFLQSELLSRRLAFYCCKRISALFNEYSNCLFEPTIKKLDAKASGTISSSLQLPPQQQQQQSSPELNKLKPFVTNINQTSLSLQSIQKKSQSQLAPPFPSTTFNTSSLSQITDLTLGSQHITEPIDYILKKKVTIKEVKSLFDKIFQSSAHREQLILLTSIVHAIQLGCMQALIWNNVGDGRLESPFNGSPLDHLPCAPSRLLFTYDYMGIDKLTKQFVRTELEKAELCIRRRSIAVENKWATDKLRQASIGSMQIKILAILDVLDKYCYDIVDVNDTIDAIYKQIFPQLDSFLNKKKKRKLTTRENVLNEGNLKADSMEIDSENELDNLEQFTYDTEDEEDETDMENDDNEEDPNKPLSDRDIIHILCDWAITVKRSGVHRIYYAVFLIKKRHIDLIKHHTETCQMIKQKLKASLVVKNNRKQKEEEYDEQLKLDTTQITIDQTISITLSNSKKRKLNDSLTNEENATNDNLLLSSAKKFKTEDDATELGDSKLNIKPFSLNSTSVLNEVPSIVSKSPNVLHKNSTENNLNNFVQGDLNDTKDLTKPSLIQIKRIKDKLARLKRYEEEKTYDFLFQKYLFDYLEYKGVQLEEKSTETRIMFTNLVSLYYMFINSKLFSHDQFVTTLITRGETFKNNLSDIKIPKQILNKRMAPSNVKQEQAYSQFNLQNQLSQPNLQHPMSQAVPNRQNSIEYASPMSAYQQPASMPAFNLAPQTPLQHQKSVSNIQSTDPLYPHSVPTPSKSLILNQSSHQLDEISLNNINNQLNSSYDAKSVQQYQQSVRSVSSVKTPLQSAPNNVQMMKRTINKPMSKLAQYVMHIPIPFSEQYRHERNQRIVVLYGFGSKKQEIIEKLLSISKNLKNLFSAKNSFDLSNSASNSSTKRFLNTITSLHLNMTNNEQENLNQIYSEYSKLTYYDQYSILNKLVLYVIEIYKSLESKSYLPKLQYIQFIFDLMESNSNIFNLLLFAIRLLNVAPNIESFFRKKFNLSSQSNNQKPFFEYLSYFYLNLIAVFRLHLASLVMWKELASQVFKCLFQLIKGIERPSKCSTHEKCAFMLMNEMYNVCNYLKQQFPQFEPFAIKIKQEKCFVQLPQFDKTTLNSVMKSDETLISMFTTSDHTINEIESYLVTKNFYYNFVAHVFVSMSNSNMSKDDMLRLANLCAELSCRLNILIPLWHSALRTLLHRDAEPTKEKTILFRELLNKINIQNPKCKENFKLFLSIMASRHCLLMTEFIINVVKTCVMAVPGITSDQSHDYTILEPTAWLACHILHYLFTSSPKSLVYRRLTSDQRMVTANFRSICFSTFLLVLKGLFLLSGTKREVNASKSSSKMSSSKSNSDKTSHAGNTDDNDLELDQYALNVLYEICEHDWIKERCFYEGDNLLKPNQLLESALNRKAQNLLHIICYPKAYHLRKQQEQASNKDFTKNILQNLDLWNLRESLLEFKLMIELEKQKENRYYEYFIECLAKTTVDFLIDSDTQMQNTPSSSSNQSVQRSNSVLSNSNQISEPLSNEPATQASTDENSQTQLANPSSVHNLNEHSMSDTAQDQQMGDPINGDMKSADNENIYEVDQIESSEDDFDMFGQLNEPSNVNQLYQTSHAVGVWLIAPLINKLQDSCQLKVLENASKILQDLGKAFWNSKNKVEKETQVLKNISAWSHQPFFSLLISCLKGKDEQRLLLNSLFYGLMDFINGKDDKILSENPRIRQIMHDTLHNRLSLVGSMFDFIMKNSNDFINWTWLFVQLICSGVIDPDNDQLLFTMVADMFVVLMHHIITLEPNLENNKHYQSIIKKISKETKDLSELPNTKAINYVRRLMPLNKSACLDVLIVDHHIITASKSISNQHDKRRAFKFSRKEKINTWELIEGVKNASAICSSWYGLARIERRMLKYEYQQKLLVRHKHMNIHKELTYFKEKCDVPNDLIEVSESTLNALTQPPPPSPVKKQESKPNDSMSKISSPSTQTADIVLIGSSAGHSHSQIMNRLQNQVSNNEKKASKTPDKQKTSTKKRANTTTTPRRNAAAVAAAGAVASQPGIPQTNSQLVGVHPNNVSVPVGGPMNQSVRNPNQMVMPPNHPTTLQQKFMASQQGQSIQQTPNMQQQQQQQMQSPLIRSTSSPMPQPPQVGNQPYPQQYPNNQIRAQQPVPQSQPSVPHQNLSMNTQIPMNNRMGTSTPPIQPSNPVPITNPNQYVQNNRQGMLQQQQIPGRPAPAPGYNAQPINPVAQPVQQIIQTQQRKQGQMAPQQPNAQMPNQLQNNQAMFNQQQMTPNQTQLNQQRMMPNQTNPQQAQSTFVNNPQVGQPKPGQTIPRNSTPDPMLMNTQQGQMMQKQPQQMPNYPNNQGQAPQPGRMQFTQQQVTQQQNFAWQQQDAQRNQIQQRPQQMQTSAYQQQTQQGMPPQGMTPGQPQQQQFMQNKLMQPGQNMMNPNMQQQQQQRGMPPNQQYQSF